MAPDHTPASRGRVRHRHPRAPRSPARLALARRALYRGHAARCLCPDDRRSPRQQRGRDLRASRARPVRRRRRHGRLRGRRGRERARGRGDLRPRAAHRGRRRRHVAVQDRSRAHVDENEIIVATRLANDRIARAAHGVLEQMGSTVARRCGSRATHARDRARRRQPRLPPARRRARAADDRSLAARADERGGHAARTRDFPWRHVVTRALGTPTGEPDVQTRSVARGRRLSAVQRRAVRGARRRRRSRRCSTLPAEAACRALVDAAYEAGSRDNISAIVVRAC